MSELTEQEKDQIFQNYASKHAREYKIGKYIIFSIAFVQLIIILVNTILTFNIFYFIIQMALLLYLLRGVRWIQYLQGRYF